MVVDKRTCWGYTFVHTEDHLSASEAHDLKYSWDTLADEALSRLNELYVHPLGSFVPKPEGNSLAPTGVPSHTTSTRGAKRDLYCLLRDNSERDSVLSELWRQVNVVPDWVDWSQISRGQEVFYRYGGPALTGLAFQSLLGGLGAARVVETLSRTGGFSTGVARRRLFETTQHILQCTRSLASIQPGGEGFASSIRVRLLHAAVRSRILRLTKVREGYYNVEKLGVPINDLDCIATIGTFSASLIWLALPRQGIFIKQSETRDFMALFRYIAYLTGTPDRYFATPERARLTMESLLLTEIKPTATSRILANNVLESLAHQPPGYPSKAFLEATARWLNGDELCDALGIGRPSLYYKALVAGQCLFFMLVCYSYREIPILDKRKIAVLRRVFWNVIMESLQEETVFDFKHKPQLGKTTRAAAVPGAALKASSVNRGAEKRNFAFFTAGCLVLALGFSFLGRLLARFVYYLAEDFP